MKPILNTCDPVTRSALADVKLREMFEKGPMRYEVYKPSKHNPIAPQRQGSNDALLLPSRVDGQLRYRNGQVKNIKE